ncbi:MAG: DUF4159 domain-containing protein [Bacteroidetes bacterium]|nr:DUF4159 domain-containing protein [Bacteroidota bacterium]MCL5737415.1 DUF4159 domain-containing protein [Bacteroidota bacterium]
MRKFCFAVLIFAFILGAAHESFAQKSSAFRIARLKYDGGGDWYNDPLEEPTLLQFVKQHTNIDVDPNYYYVDIMSDDIFTYPFLFMTGHGNIRFTDEQAKRLRLYLENGGFLYADDDYGMDLPFRREMKKVFPDKPLVELPFSYGLYHCVYDFPNGVPKIQDWKDGKPPQAFGIFLGKRLVVYYTYESNPSDGWDPPEVHSDPESKRLEALEFGTNLVYWALTH